MTETQWYVLAIGVGLLLFTLPFAVFRKQVRRRRPMYVVLLGGYVTATVSILYLVSNILSVALFLLAFVAMVLIDRLARAA